LLPARALAADTIVVAPEALSVGVGLAGLVFAVVLLVVTLRLERVAKGSAVAESVGWVVGATVVLASSMLVGWFARFLTGFSAEHARIAAELLVIASMAMLVVYFVRVRGALVRYLKGSEETLAKMQAAEDEWRERYEGGE
jgi:uncharacterized membrane protein